MIPTMKLNPVQQQLLLFTSCTRLHIDNNIDNTRIYEVTNMLPILTDLTHINRRDTTFVRPFVANVAGQYNMHVHVETHQYCYIRLE